MPQLIGHFEQWSIKVRVKPDRLDRLRNTTAMTHIANDGIYTSVLAHGVVYHCLQIINLKNRTRVTNATEFFSQLYTAV